MHTQTDSTERPRRGSDSSPLAVGGDELSSLQATALRLLSEQVAIPLDQLVRFLGLPLEAAVEVLQSLEDAGCVRHCRFLVRDMPWFWLNRRGARLAGTGFAAAAPDVAMLAHRRAINQVRLHLAERAPEGRWVCERTVFRRRDPEDHLPDAVLEIGGERHAIEAELSTKQNHEIRRIVAEHSNRYDAVLYFCGPYPYRLLKRVQAEGRWPKLIVRRVPQGEPC
jgi:DNA-binding Lrp family transcriptional regulator